jgi:hypothetical protein
VRGQVAAALDEVGPDVAAAPGLNLAPMRTTMTRPLRRHGAGVRSRATVGH